MSSNTVTVPVSAIIPTKNRAAVLSRFFDSLARQGAPPAEVVVCDASDDDQTETLVRAQQSRFGNAMRWVYLRADRTGLAPQRNQAVAAATQPYAWFLDDDVILEPGCLHHLHLIISSSEHIGGVTATLTNQCYTPPGPWVARLMRWFEHGLVRPTYACACVGPGWTFYPDASPWGPATMPAGWMIGCCTLYRKAALPQPAVPDHFEGGAIGEDLAVSLHVARTWQTLHVRAARCFHDSQGGSHKRSLVRTATQGMMNRHWIMTRVMKKETLRDHFDFALMLGFGLVSLACKPAQWGDAASVLAGYLRGTWRLVFTAKHE